MESSFSFSEIWTLYASYLGQAIPSAFGHYASAETKYLYYRCSECEFRIATEQIHQLIVTRTEHEWQKQYESFQLKQIKFIKSFLKDLYKLKANLIEEKKRTRLISPKDTEHIDHLVLMRAKNIYESAISYKIGKAVDSIKKVEEMLEYQTHPDTRSLFSKCNLKKLSSVEFGTFCLLTFSKVLVKQKDESTPRISIEYRLNPFFIEEQ